MFLLDNINTLNTWASQCRNRLYNVEDDLDWRSVSAYNLTKNGGIGYIAWYNRQVLSNLIEAMQYFVYGYTDPSAFGTWILVHHGLYQKEADITWKGIVEAWIKDDFEGRAPTIAVIDRMRQILWDEPFSVQWAARPEQQEL